MNNFILAKKQSGYSSFELVKKFRKILDTKKIGHAGTLDPSAKGLMLLATNDATKFLQFIPTDKRYNFTMQFGKTSESMDQTTPIIEENNIKPTKEDLMKILPNFLGEIEQVPNKFSAININGQKAYKLARKNIDFEIAPRKVNIYSIKFSNSELFYENDLIDSISLSAHVSSGTYIRSLAKDIAKALKTIAITTSIERTNIANFSISEIPVKEEIEENYKLITLDIFKNYYPILQLSKEEITKLSNGSQLIKENYKDDIYCCFNELDFSGLIKIIGGIIFPLRMIKK